MTHVPLSSVPPLGFDAPMLSLDDNLMVVEDFLIEGQTLLYTLFLFDMEDEQVSLSSVYYMVIGVEMGMPKVLRVGQAKPEALQASLLEPWSSDAVYTQQLQPSTFCVSDTGTTFPAYVHGVFSTTRSPFQARS